MEKIFIYIIHSVNKEEYEKEILYNVNFGHSVPRCILTYGIKATIDYNNKRIFIDEPIFEEK